MKLTPLLCSTLATCVFSARAHPLMSADDACAFIAALYAHGTAARYGEVCVGIYKRADGSVALSPEDETLSVEDALEMAKEHLAAARARDGCDELSSLLDSGVMENALMTIELVLAGVRVDQTDSVASLAAASRAVWRRASCDWTDWRESLATVTGEPVLAQLSALSQLMTRAFLTPSWNNAQRRLVGVCMYYLSDLCALVGEKHCLVLLLNELPILLMGETPQLRRFYPRESRERFPIDDLQRFGIALAANNLGAIKAAPALIRTWAGPDSLAERSIQALVAPRLCANPLAVLRSFPEAQDHLTLPITKLAVNLIELCPKDGGRRLLVGVRDWASRLQAGLAVLMTRARSRPVVAYLAGDDVSVGRGIGGDFWPAEKTDAASELLSTVLAAADDVFKPVKPDKAGTRRFMLPSESGRWLAEIYSAVGRAIGLAVRYGSYVGALGLDDRLVPLLHPRIRARVTNAEVKALAVEMGVPAEHSGEFAETVYAIGFAVEEGAGPGTFSLIADADWITLFTPLDGAFVHC